ncbi:C-GCAxxG-C-C family protein [Orenia marismortui]|uniref:C-GCAxxG-C-C family protein n=1 Tax=Orenia marismortui TaxID=46469 RepID=UPI000360046E|nr:C-GCAxxG-C-C family protein [Orenia marismortui]
MGLEGLIDQRVHAYYWEEDLNCAITILKTLGEIFEVELNSQIIDSASGIPGAGRFGGQCGLVGGALMFFGILGKKSKVSQQEIRSLCYDFADKFENTLGSLVCKELRPEGFKADNPPHLCEDITKRAVKLATNSIRHNSSFN